MGTETTEPTEPQTIVYLGNRDAVEMVTDPATGDRAAVPMFSAKRCTEIRLAAGLSLMEAARDITHPGGVWAAHCTEGATPAWVASTDNALATLLASHWKCELRAPEPDHVASGDSTGSEG